jgi:hypothetical protein
MPNIWRAAERQVTWLHGFKPEWLPNETHGKIRTLIRTTGEVGLEIDGWIGSIALANGDSLHIDSKFGSADFLRMMMRTQGIKNYSPAQTSYSDDGVSSPIKLTAHSFLQSLRRISSGAKAFEWTEDFVYSDVRPTKVNFTQTLLRAALRRSSPFAGWQQKRTINTPEHRVISAASSLAINHFSGVELRESDRRLFQSWSRMPWHRNTLPLDLQAVQNGLIANRYAGARGYYVPALRLALVILGASGLAITGEASVSASGLLTNSDALFEKYIRSVLFDAYHEEGLAFEKERRNAAFLFVNGTAPIEPDILVLQGNKILCVGDIKHKTPSINDYYQLFTYLRQYGLPRGFILSATGDPDQEVNRFLTNRDETTIVTIPLQIGNLDLLESQLSEIKDQVGF